MQVELAGGLELFNRAHFFDAHELLEDVWRSLARDQPRRKHLQGLVQLAVAFHHESTGNPLGARSLLERALQNLEGADSSFPELDLDRLRLELEAWRSYLAGVSHRPRLPQISKHRPGPQEREILEKNTPC
jgi:predicted metal-dependent hydrolase